MNDQQQKIIREAKRSLRAIMRFNDTEVLPLFKEALCQALIVASDRFTDSPTVGISISSH